jgi:hypothetical protein
MWRIFDTKAEKHKCHSSSALALLKKIISCWTFSEKLKFKDSKGLKGQQWAPRAETFSKKRKRHRKGGGIGNEKRQKRDERTYIKSLRQHVLAKISKL